MEMAIKRKIKLLDPPVSIQADAEQKLISAVISGNRVAQKELYQKYFGKMSGVTLRYTRTKEEAYEVLNDAFVKVFNNLHKFEAQSELGAWIYRIVLNTTFDHARKHYKKVSRNVELKQNDSIVENAAMSNLGLELIYDKIQLLPDTHRVVFSMYVLDGFKHKEIAEKLEISVGTSKWYLSTARTQLQELLKQARNEG